METRKQETGGRANDEMDRRTKRMIYEDGGLMSHKTLQVIEITGRGFVKKQYEP